MTAGVSAHRPPDGYRESAIGGTLVVAREDVHGAICSVVQTSTLHAWAGERPGAEPMRGRGVAWGVTLPGGQQVVVRHSRHGGMFAPVTRDFFLAPTRAPSELATALRLSELGVRTPEVLAYAVYSAAGPLCRADVVTARADGVDLPTALRENNAAEVRHDIGMAVSRLLEALWEAGAHHPDLNARNILVLRPFSARAACVLDVDRVAFGRARDTDGRRMQLNSARLQSSLLKLRGELGEGVTPNEIIGLSHFSPPTARPEIPRRRP